jgi:DNA-binding beta-propeller fold protein YncE
MILPDVSGRYVLANDLGLDRTFVYRLDGASGRLSGEGLSAVSAPPGGGPRHLAFHPNNRLLFVLNELNSTLSSFRWNSEEGTAVLIQNVSTLPEGYFGVNTTAHVVVAPSGRFVYASNRGHDSIAVFALDPDTGRLEFVERVWTMGRTPRNFAIDPSGSFLFAGNQDTDNIVGFRVNQATGRLTPTGQFVGAGQPVSFVFHAAPSAGNMTRPGVTFHANPNPVLAGSSGAARTTLFWNAPGTSELELRIGRPDGVLMGRQAQWGSATTGDWVVEGMTFYLQDVSGGRPLTAENTLGTVRAQVRMPGRQQ